MTNSILITLLTIIICILSFYLLTLRKESKFKLKKTEEIMNYTPITIATYFLKKEGQNRTITPMKIIKLVYIAQGWYLALTDGDSLINEKAEAWKYGPVIPSLYERFKSFGSNIINDIPKVDLSNLTKKDTDILDDVWNNYGNKSGIQLSGKTHEPNTPWSKVWEKAKETTKKEDLIIPNDLIMQHYQNLLAVN
jgi:uncharacterized phage-associated protein